MRVLVVDDNAELRFEIAETLRLRDHDVCACGCPQEAMEIVASGTSFDLVITDVTLAGMDGYHFIEALHTTPLREKGASFVALSGRIAPGLQARLADRGVDIVRKPVAPERFLSAIATAETREFGRALEKALTV